MRIVPLLLSFAAVLPAQDWTKDAALAEFHGLVTTKRPMAEWPERDAAIGQWLERVRATRLDLGDHGFAVGVARYFTKDYVGAAEQLLAELDRLDGRLPTGDYDTVVGRALMGFGVTAIREQQIAKAGPSLEHAVRLYSDPVMVYRAACTALASAEQSDAVALLDRLLGRMFADERLDATARQTVLKAVYAPRGGESAAARPALKPFAGRDLDGQEVSLEALKGKVVLVDFWATWCGPCLREMPHVTAAHREYHDDGFVVVGVSLDSEPTQQRGGAIVPPDPEGETTAKIRSTMARLGMDWPVVYEGGGWETRLAKENGIRSIPATFLLDRTGKVRYTNLRGDDLSKRVAELVGEK